MKLHPRVTPEALALAKRFEGLRPEAASLPGGGWVIGYGHVSAEPPARAVTAMEAEALLHYDLSRLAFAIEPLILAPTTAPQFEALLSFAFGVGVERFAASAVLKRLNAGAYLEAASALELWRVADVGGEPLVVDALVRRRAAEKARFLTPPEGFAPAPSAVLRPEPDPSLLAAAASLAAGDARVAVVDVDDRGRASLRDPPGRDGEPAASAALAAVAALSERIDRLLAAPAFRPPPAPEPHAAPAPEPAAVPGPLRPGSEPQLELGSEPEPEPPPLVASAVPPAPTPPPPSNDDAAEAAPAVEPPAAEPLALGSPARQPPALELDEPPRARVSPPAFRAPALGLGLIGLALFAAAVWRTYRAPSLLWLGLGVLAVVLMAPACLALLSPRRPAPQD